MWHWCALSALSPRMHACAACKTLHVPTQDHTPCGMPPHSRGTRPATLADRLTAVQRTLQLQLAAWKHCGLTLGPLLLQQDHEKHVQRAREVKQASTQAAAPQGSPAASAGQAPSTEAAALYKKQDLSLKEGQTIKCGTVCLQWCPTLVCNHGRCSTWHLVITISPALPAGLP